MSVMTPDEGDDAGLVPRTGMIETIAVYSAPDTISADLLMSLLASEGIDAIIGEQVSGMFAGALAVGEGYCAEVRVPADQAERARPIVEAFASGHGDEPPISDEELTAAAEAAAYDPNV